jgi:SPP1 family phage portal protein
MLRGVDMNAYITSEVIRNLIEEHTNERDRLIRNYGRYCGSADAVPILSRTVPDSQLVNNKLANDFFGEIVDTKVGYLLGISPSFQVDRAQADHARIDAMLQDFVIRENIEELLTESVKMASSTGYTYWLMFINKEGGASITHVDPWEVIAIKDRSTGEITNVLRYYYLSINGDRRIRAEWYDATDVYFYLEDEKGDFILDYTEEPKPHGFTCVPFIELENNREKQGDCDKVLNLIDAYDRGLSDLSSEVEQMRLAYLVLTGAELEDGAIERAKQTGVFEIPDVANQSKVPTLEYLTKDLNTTSVENLLATLERNILRFARSVNFTDESFGGNISGVAMKYKLFGLETKTAYTERKLVAALRRMYKLLAEHWSRFGVTVDYTNLYTTFKRNTPINLYEEAQATIALKGMVSERTRLSKLSIVNDVDWELTEMRKDKEGQTLDSDNDVEGGG